MKNLAAPTAGGFRQALGWLRVTAGLQRFLRMAIRAAWLFAAGYLLAQEVNVLTNRIPDSRDWIAAGAVLAVFPLGGMVSTWAFRDRFAWKVDRLFSLKEQISTALSVSGKKENGMLDALLLVDAKGLLGSVQKRLLWRGWFLQREVLSALIVGTVIAGLFLSIQPPAPPGLNLPAASQSVALIASMKEPTLKEVLPNGVTSLGDNTPPSTAASPNPAAASQPQPGDTGSGNAGGSQAANPAYTQAVTNALRTSGKGMTGEAASYAVGKALENMDLNQAANEMENLADLSSSLSLDTRQKLAQEMNQMADQLEQAAGANPLSQSLRDAAKALPYKSDTMNAASNAKDALDKVAAAMRGLNDALQNGDLQAATGQNGEQQGNKTDAQQTLGGATAGAGASSYATGTSAAEGSSERLQGSGQTLPINTNDTTLGNNLAPGKAEPGGDQVAAGSAGNAAIQNTGPGQNFIFPFYYSWKWRNVVESYFNRNQ